MAQELDRCIFRVLDGTGKTVGTGFVVPRTGDGGALGVTCALVVKFATEGRRPGAELRLQLYRGGDLTAQVLPGGWSDEEGDDTAFLLLDGLPAESVPVVLGGADDCIRHDFTSLGFPRYTAGENAPASAARPSGVLNGTVTSHGRRDLLEMIAESAEQGLSGAPVLDLDDDRVVGMVSNHRDMTHTRLVYAVTADTLVQRCELLALQAPAPKAAHTPQATPTGVTLAPLPAPGTLPEPGPLTAGAYLPIPRNQVFTGRKTELLALADELLYTPQSAVTAVSALQGEGGMGKTQIAVEFAYRYGRCFYGIHWVPAAAESDIAAGVALPSCGCSTATA